MPTIQTSPRTALIAQAPGVSDDRAERLGPADWVTLARAAFAVGVAALVADSFGESARTMLLVSLAIVAIVLDAVDGWVARHTRTTAAGAKFDGEVDAFLILSLSVYVARSAGMWVLAIGAARYAFLVAGWALPWMRAPLPPRYWRKFVAATQGIVLTVAAAGILPPAVAGRACGGPGPPCRVIRPRREVAVEPSPPRPSASRRRPHSVQVDPPAGRRAATEHRRRADGRRRSARLGGPGRSEPAGISDGDCVLQGPAGAARPHRSGRRPPRPRPKILALSPDSSSVW